MKRFAAVCVLSLYHLVAGADAPAVDPHAEVAAALFAASATQAALAKSVDAKLQAQQARISQLSAELKAGDDRHRAEMVAAQEAFVADLASRDRQYAAQIAVYRSAVDDIVAAPEGAAALAKFNAGDETGALTILDQLRASNEKMRAAKLRLEDAAEARRIARLALEARSRGKVTIEAAIKRFEEVVKLDPGVADDWDTLTRLYVESGRLPEARRAVDADLATAHDDVRRARALRMQSDVLQRQGDLGGGRRSAEEALAINRRMLAAHPDGADEELEVSRALIAFGEIARRQGDLDAAEKAYREEITRSRRRTAAPTARDAERSFLSSDLLHLADVLILRGEARKALETIEENVALERGLIVSQPDNPVNPRELAESLMWLSDVQISLGQFDASAKSNAEIISLVTTLLKSEPDNAWYINDLALGHMKTAYLARIQGQFDLSRESYLHARGAFEDLGAPGAGGVDVRGNHAGAVQGTGEVRLLMGDVPGAIREGRASVVTLRSIVARDPTYAGGKQYLAQALNSLAASTTASGDFAGARHLVAEAQAIDEALLKRDAGNYEAQVDLATAHLHSGEVALAEGRAKDARAPLEKSLALRRQLAKSQPGAATARSLAEVMRRLLDVPGSSITWPDFAAYVSSMQAQGLFWPADRPWVDEIQKQTGAASPTPAP